MLEQIHAVCLHLWGSSGPPPDPIWTSYVEVLPTLFRKLTEPGMSDESVKVRGILRLGKWDRTENGVKEEGRMSVYSRE